MTNREERFELIKIAFAGLLRNPNVRPFLPGEVAERAVSLVDELLIEFGKQSARELEMSPAEARQEAIAFISGGK